jgi:hypothetical protein
MPASCDAYFPTESFVAILSQIALVCVTDGCWEVLRLSDGHWDTGSHWPRLSPEQKKAWSDEQHDRLIAP